jgi:hypothetical protein
MPPGSKRRRHRWELQHVIERVAIATTGRPSLPHAKLMKAIETIGARVALLVRDT